MGIEERLTDEALKGVSGGAGNSAQDKRSQFESAWRTLGMTQKGYSGMRMAEIYDDWEMAGFQPDAITFLSQYN